MIDNNLLSELKFKTSRSGGPGGQHVNKTESKVELLFNIEESKILNDNEKTILLDNLQHKIHHDELSIVVSETRSQHKNKEIAINRFFILLKKAMKKKKKRIATVVPKKAKEKRLAEKAARSQLKKSRKNFDNEGY